MWDETVRGEASVNAVAWEVEILRFTWGPRAWGNAAAVVEPTRRMAEMNHILSGRRKANGNLSPFKSTVENIAEKKDKL